MWIINITLSSAEMTDSSVCDYIVVLKQGEWEDNLNWLASDGQSLNREGGSGDIQNDFDSFSRLSVDETLLTDFY